jgi:hypothetical protein
MRPITIPPSSHRTPFHVGVVASVAGLLDTCGNVPIALSVPERTPLSPPDNIDRNALLVLVQVDGSASVHQIAQQTGLPLNETLEAFFRLLSSGLVEIVGEELPRSGVFTRIVV